VHLRLCRLGDGVCPTKRHPPPPSPSPSPSPPRADAATPSTMRSSIESSIEASIPFGCSASPWDAHIHVALTSTSCNAPATHTMGSVARPSPGGSAVETRRSRRARCLACRQRRWSETQSIRGEMRLISCTTGIPRHPGRFKEKIGRNEDGNRAELHAHEQGCSDGCWEHCFRVTGSAIVHFWSLDFGVPRHVRPTN